MKRLGRFFFAPEGAGGGAAGDAGNTSLLNSATPPAAAAGAGAGGASDNSAGAVAAAITFKEVLGEDGGLNDNWTKVLPKELQEDAAFKNIKTFGALAKSYANAQKMVGADKVALPGKNATKDEITAFHAKIGCPETPDKYTFKTPEKMPEGINFNPDSFKAFQQFSHELGLSDKQNAALHAWHMNNLQEGVKAQDQAAVTAQAETVKTLQKEWGAAYDQELRIAQRAADLVPGGREIFVKAGVADNAEMLKVLAWFGHKMGEDTLGNDKNNLIIPTDAIVKINEIRGNKEHAYYKGDHPGHKDAVAEMNRLYKLAYPEEKK